MGRDRGRARLIRSRSRGECIASQRSLRRCAFSQPVGDRGEDRFPPVGLEQTVFETARDAGRAATADDETYADAKAL